MAAAHGRWGTSWPLWPAGDLPWPRPSTFQQVSLLRQPWSHACKAKDSDSYSPRSDLLQTWMLRPSLAPKPCCSLDGKTGCVAQKHITLRFTPSKANATIGMTHLSKRVLGKLLTQTSFVLCNICNISFLVWAVLCLCFSYPNTPI